jgi:hypothetical protein
VNSSKDVTRVPAARAANRAARLAKKLPGGGQLRGRVTAALILACCGGLVVVSIWAPVARAQLILSAVAIVAIWLRPQDK